MQRNLIRNADTELSSGSARVRVNDVQSLQSHSQPLLARQPNINAARSRTSEDKSRSLSAAQPRKFYGAERPQKRSVPPASSREHARKRVVGPGKEFRNLRHMHNAQKARSLDNNIAFGTNLAAQGAQQAERYSILENIDRQTRSNDSWHFHPEDEPANMSHTSQTTPITPESKRPLSGRARVTSDSTASMDETCGLTVQQDENNSSRVAEASRQDSGFTNVFDPSRKSESPDKSYPDRAAGGFHLLGSVDRNARVHRNRNEQKVFGPNGRVWFKGDMIIDVYVGRVSVGGTRVLHIPWDLYEPVLRLKRGHSLPLHFEPTFITRAEYDEISRARWYSYLATGSLEPFEDSRSRFDELADRLEAGNVAALWVHPTDNRMLLLYSVKSPNWSGFGSKTIREGASRLHVALRQRLDLGRLKDICGAVANGNIFEKNDLHFNSASAVSTKPHTSIHTNSTGDRVHQQHVHTARRDSEPSGIPDLKDSGPLETKTDTPTAPYIDTMETDSADIQGDVSGSVASANTVRFGGVRSIGEQLPDKLSDNLSLKDVVRHASSESSRKASKVEGKPFIIYLAFTKESGRDAVHMRQALIQLGIPTDRIWLHEEEGETWRKLRDALKSRLCLVLFERYFKLWDLRDLAKALDSGNIVCWQLVSHTIDPVQTCVFSRIFPYGTALTFSESCLKYKIHEVLYILKWFQHRATTQTFVPHRLMLPPLTSKLLETRAERAIGPQERTEYLEALRIIMVLSATDESTTQALTAVAVADKHDTSLIVQELDPQDVQDLVEPSSEDARAMVKYEETRDELILKQFSGWAYHNIHKYRRFLGFTVGTKPGKCEHVRFHLTDQFVRQKREGDTAKAVRKN